jgi:uncharacterized protein (TIGR02391 family)
MPQNNNNQKLKMTFTPNTIEHLGVRMYSTLPPVVAELVANSQDADATKVNIHLKDQESKEIIVSDNGHGMSFVDINEKFLRIGRNRRSDEGSQTSPGGRKVIGKKGLGKLSFFGIAHEIEIRTTQNYKRNSFLMKWGDILSEGERDKQKDYSPIILEYDVACEEEKGTIIILRDIQRISDFNAETLADNLSRFFIIDQDFNIYIKHNDGEEILITNERKYSNLIQEVEWDVPDDINFESTYERKLEVKGHLIATEKPIPPATNMKGITLFSRRKLVNIPEYFSDSTSSHFFTYLTGWLEVDFIDDFGEDVIGTNRQSLNWEHPDMFKLREYLQKMLRWLEIDWREKRKKVKDKKLRKIMEDRGESISEWQSHVPDELNDKINPIIKSLLEKSEFSDEELSGAVKNLKDLIPPYPYYHYKSLHGTLSSEVFDYYKNQDYYGAVFEGVKRYIQEVKNKTGSALTDRNLLENIFAINNPSWSITKKFKRPNGSDFHNDTIKNITEGHQKLVVAMWQAFRDPMSHDPVKDLRDSGLYTEQDCLDALGLLSHLFRRLDNAETL